MHLYDVMDMPRLHQLLQSLLAPCHQDHIVAVALLLATKKLLPISECTVINSKASSTICIIDSL